MNVLITGGAGFIGSNLAKLLMNRHRLTIVDDFHPYYDVSRKRAQLEAVKKAGDTPFIQANLIDEQSCQQLFTEHSFDAVYHLAALPGVSYSMQRPHEYIDHNLKATTNVLKWAGKTGVKHVLFASSSSVYGDQEGTPLREDMVSGQVISPYAATKVGGEALCSAYQHMFGFQLTILRFFSVYGPWGRPDMAISMFIKKLLHEEEIEIFGEDTARDYTYIDDITSGLEAALASPLDYGVYNLGFGSPVTMSSLLAEFKGHFPQMKVVYKPWRQGDVKMTWSDSGKARELLGFEPKVSIGAGLAHTIEWAKGNISYL